MDKIQNIDSKLPAGSGAAQSGAHWVFRALFLGLICFYASFIGTQPTGFLPERLSLISALLPQEVAAAVLGIDDAETDEDGALDEFALLEGASLDGAPSDYGMGGAALPAGDAVIENVSFENLESAAVLPEEYRSAQPVLYTRYKVESGDVAGRIAQNFGLNLDTLYSVNGIKNSRSLPAGKVLKVPNQDGILYTIKSGDTLEAIAEKYKIEGADILTANEYFTAALKADDTVFLPGAKLDPLALQEINGDLFIWPTSSRYITSSYGWRRSPISGSRLFHTGIDIRGGTGAPVYAAMSGRVTYAGYNEVFGNHIVITHHSGYRTLYGHLNVIRVKNGVYVTTGQRIGDVGNTGASTGPHLHFTVYRNGVTINPRILMN